MKRIALFLATNLAIVLVFSVTARALGLEPYLEESRLNRGALFAFAALIGSGGAFLSLALSKWTAKRACRGSSGTWWTAWCSGPSAATVLPSSSP